LGRITAERNHIFDSFFLELPKNGPGLFLRLADNGQVAHNLQPAFPVDPIDQMNGFFARASASPVRNRAKGRIQPLDNFDFAEEVFLAFVRLWRKEFNR
jgi:hypothetical protein